MKRKGYIIAISFLGCAAVALGIYSGVLWKRTKDYENTISANYQHAFGELVTSVSEIDAALQKSMYATSPSMAASVCTEVFGKAMTAQMSLGVLPFSTYELEQTAGFISRVGDYAYALTRVTSAGSAYTDEQKENLKALSASADLLSQNLTQLQADMADGRLTMDELKKSEERVDKLEGSLPTTVGESMRLIEQEFPETPSLIYDGPFSEHITDMEPKMLEGREQIDENAGRRAAARFLGMNEGKVYPSGESEGHIPSMYFSADADGATLTVQVSKAGGVVLDMLSSRQPEQAAVSDEEAIAAAKRFLELRGYDSMAESYHVKQGNIMTVNFAYEQDGVICYSDLVKVSVALDNCHITGFEASGYVTSHCWRELPQPAVSEDDARAMVSSDLEVLSSGMALVPSDGKYETLCYEFKCGSSDGRHYIIYVNAQTGNQEKILILLEDENGTLTL